MPARRPAALGAAALFLIAMACDTPPPPTGTLHTDSAGVPIATAVTPLSPPGEAWTVGELLAEIGTIDGPPEYQFADVVAAVRLDNGDIVVADRGASELRSYDAEGNFQWRTGREGEGPGEFRGLDYLGRMAGDSLVTYDPTLLRIQVFDAGGRLSRTLRAELPRDVGSPGGSAADRAVGVAGGRLIIRFVELNDEATTGIARWIDYRLVAVDLQDGAATSLIVVDGEEVELRGGDGGGYSENYYVFGNMPEFGAAAGTIAVIDTEAYRVRLVSALDGATERIIRREVAPRAVTDAVFEAELDGIVEMVFPNPDAAPAGEVDMFRRMWRGYTRAPVLPVLRSVQVDAQGSVWVAPFHLAGADPAPFDVFAPDGTWLGTVALPPRLVRAYIHYRSPYLEIGGDYVLGVWTGELDVQYVRMYRLHR
ncbi:MAG: hypothetical protein F4237_07900 [Gemmatimonadetes bacterium]|nr:hypothetical protein [Gemmatimonadota bacterium]MYE69954.1 hypothetical protein [Gemmatimonadota bacterium]